MTSAEPKTSETRIVGQRLTRSEGHGLVTGQQHYVADLSLPGMLHVKAKLSPYANARIVRIDVSAAEAMPGVVAVITHADVPNNRHGVFVEDQPVLADEYVRYLAEPIAAVAAVDEMTAADAVELIEVDFEPLDPVFDPIHSLSAEAATVHEGGNEAKITDEHFHRVIRKGDFDQAVREADFVIESEFVTQVREHAPMETHASLATVDGHGKLIIHTCSQAPHLHQLSIAKILGLPLHRVRLAGGRVGGGFGSKNELLIDHITALLALKTKRPVKWVWTREEECLVSTKDQAFHVKYASAVKRDGTLLGRRVEAVRDNGAYTIFGTDAITKMGCYAPGPYNIPHYWYDGRVAFTNKPPSGAMRGYNVSDAHIVCEIHTDEIADALGMDPLELRLRNLLRDGDRGSTDNVVDEVTLRECLEAAARTMNWTLPDGSKESAEKPVLDQPSDQDRRRGIGLCAGWQGTGSTGGGDPSTAEVEILADGSVIVRTGAVEIGAGEGTTLAMIAAEELGVPLQSITIAMGDTETTPFDIGTFGNRITWIAGLAIKQAASDVLQQLLEQAAALLSAPVVDLTMRDGVVRVEGKDDVSVTIAELAGALKFGRGVPIIGKGGHMPSASALDPATGLGNPTEALIFAAFIAEVEVDLRTGDVALIRSVLVHDVGKAINPLFVEGQMDGGMAFGVANALFEDFFPHYPDIRHMSRGLHEYKIMTAMDIHADHTNVILEIPAKKGPFGAKALGEYTANLQAPAILNAIHDATGVWVRTLPATPEKLLRLIREQANEQP